MTGSSFSAALAPGRSLGRSLEIGFKLMFLVASPLLVYGFARHIYQLLSGLQLTSARLGFFAAGFLAFSILWFAKLRRVEFFATFEHELTHLLFGLLFLKRPHSLQAYDREGAVQLGGHNFIIGLAPYTFPTFAYMLIGLGWFFERPQLPALAFLIGSTTAFHIFTTLDETGSHQPDLRREGLAFSWVFITVVNLITYGGIVAFTLRGLGGFTRYWSKGAALAMQPLSGVVG